MEKWTGLRQAGGKDWFLGPSQVLAECGSGHGRQDSPESQEGGRIFRTGAPLGAVESGGWKAGLICVSNSSWEELTLST